MPRWIGSKIDGTRGGGSGGRGGRGRRVGGADAGWWAWLAHLFADVGCGRVRLCRRVVAVERSRQGEQRGSQRWPAERVAADHLDGDQVRPAVVSVDPDVAAAAGGAQL